MASELECLFLRELGLEAEPYAYGIFSTHYKLPLRNDRSFEFYERHRGVACVTIDDKHFRFETQEGAMDAARQVLAYHLL
jgi:hypothetical protein